MTIRRSASIFTPMLTAFIGAQLDGVALASNSAQG